MKRSHFPQSLFLTGALAVSLLGCVDSADSLIILRNQQPGNECVIPDGKNALFISRGIIDVTNLDQTNGYLFTPIVLSRTEGNQSTDRLIVIRGANVDLGFIDGLFSGSELSQLKTDGNSRFIQEFSGTIEAGGTSTFAFNIIPRATLQAISNKLGNGESTRVLAEIEVVGELDGDSVSSSVFRYPVDVCKGCLVNTIGACSDVPSSFNIEEGGACQVMQDGVVDCCTEEDGGLRCPAVSSE